jgi:SNF2 family DNA or RNA helicase
VILDWNPSTGAYWLRVGRGEADVDRLIKEHGLDLSDTATTASSAVLVTHEPYAAALFAPKYGTARAKANLAHLLRQIELSQTSVGTGHYPVPYDKELWGFQVADLDYIRPRTNTLVGDQPGLGKTEVAIVYANEIQAQRVLCIVPASIRVQWVERINQWTTLPWPYTIHQIDNGTQGVNPHAHWTVVSYDLARTQGIGSALAANHYDLLILDEAHYLKGVDRARTQAIFGGGDAPLFAAIASRADHIIALTGTPLPNRPREAYTLARGLCFESIDWVSEDRFKERFNPSAQVSVQKMDPLTGKTKLVTYNDERSGRHWELQARLRTNFMTRHLKREVMTQLKMPVYDLIKLEPTGSCKMALDKEQLLDIDPETLKGRHADIFGEMSTVRLEMGLAMAPGVAEHINMLIDGGEDKLVLFAWHIEVLNILEKRLAHHGVCRVMGAGDKAQKVKRFIKDPSKKIIMGNMMTLGIGTDDLQHIAWHALIAEPDWVAGNNVQAFDRLDRGGQTRTVQGDIFVVEGSVAERILATALKKYQTTDKVLDRKIL